MVGKKPERPKDVLQAHYTTSPEIVKYMVAKLRANDDDSVWEPCAGNGALIDGLLAERPNIPVRASEISETAVSTLKEKYETFPNVEVYCEDALDVNAHPLFESELPFTRILANPPYGAYLTPERRSVLKNRYPRLYVKETYGLLLYHSLNLTRASGRIVFIIPDTFLWLHRHEFLRRTLFTKTTVEEIVLFPSKFFPGVKFGYSGLCIITLVNNPPPETHRIRVVENLVCSTVLSDCAAGKYLPRRCSVSKISQKETSRRPNAELIKEQVTNGRSGGTSALLTLGDVAEVRTGFYSGNDRRWIRRANSFVPRAKPYADVEPSLISVLDPPSLQGIDEPRCFIPILRGGSAPFHRSTLWYVDWSANAVAEYKRTGKNPARFQNAQFYFKEGIGVPMVASSRLTGALLERRLFDQGIVGVFPSDPNLMRYWLGFLNTELATILLRQINPTANNSANYLKRLPVILPSPEELEDCNRLVSGAIEECRVSKNLDPELSRKLESLYRSIWERQKAGNDR